MEERIKRGEVYYVYPSGYETGSEQIAGRPAIVVSNNRANEYSSVIEMVFLTTKEKTQLPTHVIITSLERQSVALCEQVNSISKMRLGDLMGICTDEEMQLIDKALCDSLGIEEKPQAVNVAEQLNQARSSIVDKLSSIRVKAVKRADGATSEKYSANNAG